MTATETQQLHQNHAFLKMPTELQVRTLTYLRAYELTAVHQTCKYLSNPDLIHSIVSYTSELVYPSKLTMGFAEQAVDSDSKQKKTSRNSKETGILFTLQHMRNMELLVIARILSSPETATPSNGYIVSKSWVKSTLKWLEATTAKAESYSKSPAKSKKKMTKKKQRMRDRKLSDVSPPWPNVNSDLLCEHLCLSRCSNGKSARARRRCVDKNAWKILKRLYPDSTSLEAATGECLQCLAEAEMVKKTQRDEEEALKLERKQPLSNPVLRRFYTRRSGVPSQCMKKPVPPSNEAITLPSTEESLERCCPMKDGTYFIVPRSWCHHWRRYIRTGEGGQCGAPDAGELVCDAHRLLLVPPHLEAFIKGENPQLLASNDFIADTAAVPVVSESTTAIPAEQNIEGPQGVASLPRTIPGQTADPAVVQAMLDAGLSDEQVGHQLSALRLLEQQRQQRNNVMLDNIDAPVAASTPSKNELLDRENHSVVEILSKSEYQALEACWPPGSSFGLRLEIADGRDVWCTQLCRDCDVTGRSHDFHIKNRWVKKPSDKSRTPASLEY